MSGIEIRPVVREELDDFYLCFSRALGFPPPTGEAAEWQRDHFLYERSLAAFDGEEVVGTAHSHLFELTLPGGQLVSTAGVTAVAVAATHRRQGILRQMMNRQLSEARQRGEAAAILLASESLIYGRFGYGMATMIMDFEIDARRAGFREPVSMPGRVRFIDEETVAKVLPDVFDRARRVQPGAIGRDALWWEGFLRDRKPGRETVAVYENASGRIDGYARYRSQAQWDAALANYTVNLHEMFTTTVEASAALWHHCLNIDLAAKVVASARPPDEPLRWMLADPRQIRPTRYTDLLWLRILDVPAVLAGRTYRTSDRLNIHVVDDMFPDISGVYELETSPEQSRCVRTQAEPDIEIAIADLGACALGEVSFTELARAYRVREISAGASSRADAAFTASPRPWCNTGF